MQDEHGKDPDSSDEAPGPGPLADVYGRPSAARSEGQLYAPPKTVPPTSDHRTIEIETVKVQKDPQRAAVTQLSLRKQAEQSGQVPPGPQPHEVPDSTHPVIAGERARGSSAVWFIALGALIALVAVGVALARGSSTATEASASAAPALGAPSPSAATPSTETTGAASPVASAAPPTTSAEPPSNRAAPPGTSAAAALSAAPAPSPARHTAAAEPRSTHQATKPAASSKPKYQPLF